HPRRPAEGPARATLDPVPPAAEPERRVLGRADVEGRGAVRDREGPVPGRADAADERAGGRRAAVAGRRQAAGDAAPRGQVRRPEGVPVLARVTANVSSIWAGTPTRSGR